MGRGKCGLEVMVVFEGEKSNCATCCERGGMSDCDNGGLTPWFWVASLAFAVYAAVYVKGREKRWEDLGGGAGNDAADAFARDTSQGRSGSRGDVASSPRLARVASQEAERAVRSRALLLFLAS